MTMEVSGPQAASPVASTASAPVALRFKTEPEVGSAWPVALAFVLVLAAVGAWIVRRQGRGLLPAGSPSTSQRLAVRETVWVAPKLRVSRLEYDGRTMLLASSPHGLAWLDLGDAPRTAADQEAPDA